ncbi:MAG: poly(R)-hydroxyalkanoic acid synthase subunit PhaE [Desulfobaccales bacterium]
MAQEFSHKPTTEPLLTAWIKWTMDFWETMAQMGPAPAGSGRVGGQAYAAAAAPKDPWGSSLKLWQTFFALLTVPGSMAAVFQGIKAPSEIILRMAQAGWGGYFHLHRQWLEGWQGGGTWAGESGYETLDQEIFKICHEIYEDNFSQLLDLPHLRLTGLPQERINRAMDKFNQFQAAMAEFIYLLFRPVKKSLRAMRGVGGDGREENPPEDFKEYYKGWLRILEGHYMTLFQSVEYTRTLSQTLNALEDFTLAKQELLADALEALSLPSRRDLDELYREMYLLKKRNKVMAKKLAEIEPSGEKG